MCTLSKTITDTKAEVLEIITQMIAYCGFPAATNALLAAQEVFSEIERA